MLVYQRVSTPQLDVEPQVMAKSKNLKIHQDFIIVQTPFGRMFHVKFRGASKLSSPINSILVVHTI